MGGWDGKGGSLGVGSFLRRGVRPGVEQIGADEVGSKLSCSVGWAQSKWGMLVCGGLMGVDKRTKGSIAETKGKSGPTSRSSQ